LNDHQEYPIIWRMMESHYYIMAIILGLLGGVWVGEFQVLLAYRLPSRPSLRLGLSVLGPSIVWIALTFGILAAGGSSIPDWIGMSALVTGFAVFVLSIVGVILRKAVPNANLFLISITAISIFMQLLRCYEF
jgi:hypothetical protein